MDRHRGETARSRGRLETFSDGVMAIIVTLMVFQLKPPARPDAHALLEMWPMFLAYFLSFVFVAVIWVNHHHIFRFASEVDTWTLWSNMILLFSMSLIPFASAFLAANPTAPFPVACYAALFCFCLLGHMALSRSIIRRRTRLDEEERRWRAMASRKNRIGLMLYLLAIPLAYSSTWASIAVDVAVAVLYALPRRMGTSDSAA